MFIKLYSFSPSRKFSFNSSLKERIFIVALCPITPSKTICLPKMFRSLENSLCCDYKAGYYTRNDKNVSSIQVRKHFTNSSHGVLFFWLLGRKRCIKQDRTHFKKLRDRQSLKFNTGGIKCYAKQQAPDFSLVGVRQVTTSKRYYVKILIEWHKPNERFC